MSKKAATAITPTRSENYPEWYQQVIKAGDLSESSPVRGCMVIKPWGYALWENIQAVLDKMFKDTGHVNACFPLLIPKSFLEKEAEHVEGFAKECAVVTHHRLEDDGKGGLKPAGELEEPYVIRPTSETIIGDAYARWVQSYRDLPILINQWANVMRWEMRTRAFLRTSEFLWQEGHTAHATEDEAMEETLKMLEVYRTFAEDYAAIPVIPGEKTADERFPGAVRTYTIEAMMQDGKALQSGTSHFLGQNFAKASGITFLDQEGTEQHAWTTSWGVSTRMIGGIIMTHSDDDGLVLPPKLAPQHIVILPIYRKDEEKERVLAFVDKLKQALASVEYAGAAVRFFVDDRDLRGGEKAWQHIKKGVPVRVEIGPRDEAKGTVFVGRRDQGAKDKQSLTLEDFVAKLPDMLNDMQSGLLDKARKLRNSKIRVVENLSALKEHFAQTSQGPLEGKGINSLEAPGFVLARWSEKDQSAFEHLKPLKVTARCIPHSPQELIDDQEQRDRHLTGEEGACIFSGQSTSRLVLFGRSY